ncbi:MAG: ABC transporter ATP-binding protein [Treponema sp.]|nr:ABC transporter ATP-binding protein [Treponema sp.]
MENLQTEKLSVGYSKEVIIQNITFKIKSGKILTIIGPNGSGKSTILKTLTHQLKPIDGKVSVLEQDMHRLKNSQIAKCISMVTTERIHPECMTCRDVVSTGRYPYTGKLGILTPEDWQEVDSAMKMVHAESVANKDFNRISDGQRQRIMLARAICQDTPIIILDEPTSFLDMHYKLDILKTIWHLARNKNKSIIMALHELDLVKAISDTIICVNDSHIVKAGSPNEIFSGNFIQQLYGLEDNEFDPSTGTLFLRLNDYHMQHKA